MTLNLVIFDCDGVLVDSEGVSRAVVLAEAAAVGWEIDEAVAVGFTGQRWSDLQAVFEAAIGRPLPLDWPVRMQALLLARIAQGLAAMPGAAEAIRAVAALGLPYRVASNSSHEEMVAKFAATGLTDLVAGRVHSAKDVGVGKPAPDLFLAAAAAQGVAPETCLVVEDSRPGVIAATRAGVACVGYAPQGDVFGLAGLGATVIGSLGELPAVITALRLAVAA